MAPPVRVLVAKPIRVELPDGREIRVQPASLTQCVECLALDPTPGGPPESEAARLLRRRGQLAALLGREHAHIAGELGLEQAAELAGALYAAACGYDPADWQKLQAHLRKTAIAKDNLDTIQALDSLTVELAAELKKLPAEVGAQPLADALSLREQLAKLAKSDLKTQAALHGLTLG